MDLSIYLKKKSNSTEFTVPFHASHFCLFSSILERINNSRLAVGARDIRNRGARVGSLISKMFLKFVVVVIFLNNMSRFHIYVLHVYLIT